MLGSLHGYKKKSETNNKTIITIIFKKMYYVYSEVGVAYSFKHLTTSPFTTGA